MPMGGAVDTGRVEHVVAAERVDHESVVGRRGAEDGHGGRQPCTRSTPLSVAAMTMSSPFVALTVTVSAIGIGRAGAGRVREVRVHGRQIGPADVVDDEVVGAAEGLEVDALDVVQVHHDVAEVAEEPHPSAVRRDVEVLRAVGAVEQHRVGAVLALDDVAAVARDPTGTRRRRRP